MRSEHRDAAAYELGVLDDAEEFETHLAGCPRCRDLLTGFHPVSEALAEAARLGYLPVGGSPGGDPPISGESPGPGSSAGSPASGGSDRDSLAVRGSAAGDSADHGSLTFRGSAGAGSPPLGGSPAADDPAPGGSARQRSGAAGPGYPPPSDGAARRRKPCVFSRRRGMAVGALLLGVALVHSARPAVARTWFASAASIVSPAQVVAGTGRDLRDLPWSAGFQ
ncbi:hypothetical protein Amsp01_078220 [Amycolatopsis sp. NBRC 101858]|uniref:zf-HC2 domain-containing protein n=1 Tax=Amycolatopsis sp. NBRC 101858 TaxID=3032200 RepID=UPI0024A1EC8F|nr:zf-HC2 domain-containing protein [Amycolatopsis sp. NBRC 101858]GLY41799.1 hypothetical protein Amsp01_078220 [Amycolatopsis sp. NBRC 101858]